MSTKRLQGVVVRIQHDRNYGFIVRDDKPGTDLFFYSTAAEDFVSLREGDPVTFIEAKTQKGPRALAVKKTK